ncbi:hypothetical protein M0804_004501 [Polistes exclamans]|nr:hypothetical protein M0804_004501 [Polistes exclamans]
MSEAPKNGDHSKRNERVRTVTDSVHERFREIRVYCDICRLDFIGNHKEIEKHFNNSHPSTTMCCYCKGKVFKYQELREYSFDSKEPQEFIYHKCHNSR